MRTIIAGSRTLGLSSAREAMAECGWTATEVVCGCARGVDVAGEHWATEKAIPVLRFPADWTRYGRSAGYRRNELMAQNADALVAVWDGHSRGTKHMIDIARRAGLLVFVYLPDGPTAGLEEQAK